MRYLTDVYCLGVKNVLGPEITDEVALRRFLPDYYSAYPHGWQDAPIELARHVVFGAVDYAHSLGFPPAAAFTLRACPSDAQVPGTGPLLIAVFLLASGDVIDAATALDWGLVNRVVPDDELDRAIAELLGRATQGSRGSKALASRPCMHSSIATRRMPTRSGSR